MSIESAIKAARAVAVRSGAEELRRRSKGTSGTWSEDDERNLRAGFMRVWNPHAKRWDRLPVPVPMGGR